MSEKLRNLIVEIEALHDEITGNYVLYTEEALNDIETWISPYHKPAILHHKDEDGQIVGRVLEAKKIASQIKPGLSSLWLKARITDPDMIRGIKNGTYLTTSVGARGTHVECSICGHRIDSGYACPHKKGKKYKGQLCYWIVKGMTAKEISFVIVPSDKYSQIVKFYDEEIQEEIQETKTNSTKTIEKKEGETGMNLEEALAKISDLEAANATLTTDLEAAQTTLKEAQDELASEVALREGLEAEVQTIKLAEKTSDIDDILSLREKLGLREIAREVFEAKEASQLKESLVDLQAELDFKESQASDLAQETEQEDQTSQTEQDDELAKLKESQKINNTDLPIDSKAPAKKVDAKSIVDKLFK